jgi:hypothetical protein
MTKPQQDREYSEKEAAQRRDEIIKRMIAMPPKPHSEMKMGKSPPQHRVVKDKKSVAKKTKSKKKRPGK